MDRRAISRFVFIGYIFAIFLFGFSWGLAFSVEMIISYIIIIWTIAFLMILLIISNKYMLSDFFTF